MADSVCGRQCSPPNSVLLQKDAIALRRMQDDPQDYQLMAKWLTDAAVLAFYEGRDRPYDLAKVWGKYAPRVLAQEAVVPWIAMYQGLAIGYLQYYRLTETDQQSYGIDNIDNRTTSYGIDLFIGETSYWNQGLGKIIVSTALTYLFEHLQADTVVIGPRVSNTRAIRCYEKCGFIKVKRLPNHELHEGRHEDCWLMVAEQPR